MNTKKEDLIILGHLDIIVAPMPYTNVHKGLYNTPALLFFKLKEKIDFDKPNIEILREAQEIAFTATPDYVFAFDNNSIIMFDEAIIALKKMYQAKNN